MGRAAASSLSDPSLEPSELGIQSDVSISGRLDRSIDNTGVGFAEEIAI